MHDRSLLGPADVDDDRLAAMVADLLGHPVEDVDVTCSTAIPVTTTCPRSPPPRGTGCRGPRRRPPASRTSGSSSSTCSRGSGHPFFAMVPPEFRAMAAAGVPWRTEPLAYRSDLGDRLPAGLTMPARARRVRPRRAVGSDLARGDPAPTDPPGTSTATGARPYLLGRLAASPARRGASPTSGSSRGRSSTYVEGRLGVAGAAGPPGRGPVAAPSWRVPSTTTCGPGCWPRPTRRRLRRGAVAGYPRLCVPRRRQPQQPAGGPDTRRLRPHRLRLLAGQPGRLRPRPAAGRRRPDRPPLPRPARRDRRRDRAGVRPRAEGRGLRPRRARRPARPRPAPADLHRAVHAAVRAPRPPPTPSSTRPRPRAPRSRGSASTCSTRPAAS